MPHVVIVGAGVSGAACAERLAITTPPDVKITILDSAARVGGRTLSLQTRSGAVVDAGGQWIGAKQDAALHVIRELGLSLHPQHSRGKRVLQLSGSIRTYTGLIPNASLAVLVDAQLTLLLIALLRGLLWCLPATSFLARWCDGASVAALTRRAMWTHGGRALVRVVVQGLFGVEPEDLSVLAFCRYVGASGGVEAMTEVGPGTLQCWTVVGGTQQLSVGLLARVSARVRVALEHRVVSLQCGGGGGRGSGDDGGGGAPVRVTCANGAVLEADAVVLALPPPLAGNITFRPELEAPRCALMAGARMGGIIKSVAVYERAFWREAGFSGELVADTSGAGVGPVFNGFDNCVPRAAAAAAAAANPLSASAGAAAGLHVTACGEDAMLPALVLFINGARAVEWSARAPEERRAAVLAQLARYYGPAALNPVEYIEKDWVADEHTRGCPIASYPAAVLSAYGLPRRLAEPCWPAGSGGGGARHLLHWAGTETATVGTGFIDGAIRAGWAAAEGVARDLALSGADEGAEHRASPLRAPAEALGTNQGLLMNEM
jgi:monoamine oxidase